MHTYICIFRCKWMFTNIYLEVYVYRFRDLFLIEQILVKVAYPWDNSIISNCIYICIPICIFVYENIQLEVYTYYKRTSLFN
jgi:hypothetical protein